MKKCIACGMPMEKADDFAMGDTSKDYCKYCAKEDGSMQSYEEKLVSLTNFIVKTQGIKENVAKEAAISQMSKLPAWVSIAEVR
jgi:hypothetical protein